MARRLVSVAGHGPPARGTQPRDDRADRRAQARPAVDDQHRQAALPARPGDPHARPGAAEARPQAGRRPDDEVLPDRPARECRLPGSQSDQSVRDRIGRLPAGRRADRGELPRRLPRRRDDQPDDGRGQAVRPAAVQGRSHARSAVLPARPDYQGPSPGRLRLRQARRRRDRDCCSRIDRCSAAGVSTRTSPRPCSGVPS